MTFHYDTRQRFFRWMLALCALVLPSFPIHAATYDIGPGQTYTTINSFPWYNLQAGDVVQIHYGVYHEFINVSSRGTATSPIKVIGISDPTYGQPVIDGQNAVVGPYAHFQYTSGTPARGIVGIGPSNTAATGSKPGYITISNLTIRNANGYTPYNFTDSSGAQHPFGSAAAGIYVLTGEHVVIDHCTVYGNDNGIFVQSGGDGSDGNGTEATESRDITVQYSHIYGNGTPNSDQRHNTYTEASGMVYQYNLFGPLVASSLGINIKDRSAGTVIRYNWIEGGSRMIDLVDPDESADVTTKEAMFPYTFVYGNILLNDLTSSRMVHYGGDLGVPANDRKQTLYFYNNTIVVHQDQSKLWETQLLQLCDTGLSNCDGSQVADVRNNIFYATAVTSGAAAPYIEFGSDGTFNIYANWMSPGWREGQGGTVNTGVYNGTSNLFVDPANNPSFNSLSGLDFGLASGSNATNKSVALATAVTSNPSGTSYGVTSQYVRDQQGTARSSASDFGAFQSTGGGGTKTTPTVSWSTPSSITYGTALSSTQLNASASVAGTWAYSPAAGAVLGAGTQTLSATFTPTDTIHYNNASASVSLVVNKASLTVTANNASKTQGSANPTFTASYSGFVNGDTTSALSGSPGLTTTATASSPAGSYPITAAAGTLAAANYSFTFVNGTLTVTSGGTNTTVTFQQGVSSYAGNVTAYIDNIYTDQSWDTAGTASQNSALNSMLMEASTSPLNGTVSYESLLKFTNLGIPTTAVVSSATLTLYVNNWHPNGPWTGYYFAVPWNSTSASYFNWGNRDSGVPWNTPGARGIGTDLISGQSFTVPSLAQTGDQTIVISLSPAVVQNWISTPSSNNGILLIDSYPNGGDQNATIYSSTYSTVAKRPILSVTYH